MIAFPKSGWTTTSVNGTSVTSATGTKSLVNVSDLAAPPEQLGQGENKRNLGNLRRLERECAKIVPANRAVQIGAEEEDADEQQDRYSQRNRPYFQQNPVIEQRGREHDDKSGREENNRLHRRIGKARISRRSHYK